MRFDFWNHPLVVSAFRVKFRGKIATSMAAVYVLALVGLGYVMWYQAQQFPTNWTLNFVMIVCIAQTAIAAVGCLTSVQSAMHAEVTNRTLDYQRTAGIGPYSLLLGKMLGEPVRPYLMLLAGLPVLVWGWAVTGLGISSLVFVVLSFATTAALFGSLGLMYPYARSLDKPGRGNAFSGLWVFLGIMYFNMVSAATYARMGQPGTLPWHVEVAALAAPVATIFGIRDGDPWLYAMDWFGLRVPFIVATPIAQLVLAATIVRQVGRRLPLPVLPSISKPAAYAILIVVDVFLMGSFYDSFAGTSPISPLTLALVIHSLVASLLAIMSSPGHDCLMTWIWRFRGKRPWIIDSLWGDRAQAMVAQLAMCLIGLAMGVAMVLMSADAASADTWREAVTIMALASVVFLALGFAYQGLIAILPSQVAVVLFLVVVGWIAGFVPPMLGLYYENAFLASLSPAVHFWSWIAPESMGDLRNFGLTVVPCFVIYGVVPIAAALWLRYYMRVMTRVVDRKLVKMDVVPPQALAAAPAVAAS